MKDHSQENSMVTGLGFEESMEIPEVKFIRETVNVVNHDFPLLTRIEAVLIGFSDDEFDVDMAVEVLKECQIAIRKADENFQSIRSLTDDIDKGLLKLKGNVRVQA